MEYYAIYHNGPTAPDKTSFILRRFGLLADHVNISHPFVVLWTHVKCINGTHMYKYYQQIARDHGEGLLFRQPTSPYQNGKSRSWFKLVPQGREAIVTSASDEGYICKLPSELSFKVDNVDETEEVPASLAVGDVVSFDSEGTTPKEVPVNPIITGLLSHTTRDEIS